MSDKASQGKRIQENMARRRTAASSRSPKIGLVNNGSYPTPF